jgi:hypothetical protein
MALKLSTSNKGWHSQWFYLKNNTATPLPGYTGRIHLRNSRADEYMALKLSTSNKGWHSQWFYLKNDVAAPLPGYTGRMIEEAPEQW